MTAAAELALLALDQREAFDVKRHGLVRGVILSLVADRRVHTGDAKGFHLGHHLAHLSGEAIFGPEHDLRDLGGVDSTLAVHVAVSNGPAASGGSRTQTFYVTYPTYPT